MLCSLYVFAESCEGILHEQIQLKLEEQDEEYSKLKISTPEQIYACIEVNIPNTYVYNKNSKFLILDSASLCILLASCNFSARDKLGDW